MKFPNSKTIQLVALLATIFPFTYVVQAQSGQWTQTTSLPEGYMAQALTYWNGFLYQTGGEGATHGVIDGTNVYYASVQNNGTVGSWQLGPPLPIATLYHVGVAANGYLYVIAGLNFSPQSGLVFTNSVYYSIINSDGTLGGWQATTPLPTVLDLSAACVWSNSIYVIDGDPDTGRGSSNIYSATIQADGTLSSWRTLTPLSAALYGEAGTANGFLYVLGGSTGRAVLNNVYYSKINADGSLGDWSQTTPMPDAVVQLGVVAADGFVFSIGGFNGSETAFNSFYTAQVAGDGSLVSWTQGPSLPQPLLNFGTAVAGSYIFIVGGDNSSGTQKTVYSMPLPLPPATPVLTTPATNQSFQLQLISSTNTGFGILASPDLVNWTNIGWGFTDTNGLLTFQDTNASSFPYRFYRAYWPLP